MNCKIFAHNSHGQLNGRSFKKGAGTMPKDIIVEKCILRECVVFSNGINVAMVLKF